ncbi:mycofactocin oligosaccharide methyltransferase MftM [Sciscionella sediminilitoris]|uniref:mycofactocin oligosaccharide methyltransferase MftM n=1 Tax=Sciscionella sediminilitoris TaxID=1445613 RepID=UPI00068DCAEE|nr:mycofactocin oligosaccharide methyltransferase MftM [Sciscionella sp. SE31]
MSAVNPDKITVTRRKTDDEQECLARTEHFRLQRHGTAIELQHALESEEIDNNLTGLLQHELFEPGLLHGNSVFEQVFTDIVNSVGSDESSAWRYFYTNTINRIHHHIRGRSRHERSTIAEMAPIYANVLELVKGQRLLDLGSCFGFLPMLLAEPGDATVIATDHSAEAMRLLDTMACERRLPLQTVVCDAARVPMVDRSVDTVTVIHLLEHLEPAHGSAVVREALRIAARRVVIAVPFEDTPNPTFGHIRCFDSHTLAELGAQSARPYTVYERHGGWLVLDNGTEECSTATTHMEQS